MSDLHDLPRDWLLRDLAVQTAGETKLMIAQAVMWGFDEPEGLSNQSKRWEWLRECRGKAWDMLAHGKEARQPGKSQPVKTLAQRRAAKSKAKSRSRISAEEANEWLRSLPLPQYT